ncbi:MAG: metallophosphoesterase [Verrucomicrobia bacterium]|nr:MAG: metallophosphoesterase [Verrucomicrobiota bacterium]
MFTLLSLLLIAYAALHVLFYHALVAAFAPPRIVRFTLRWLLPLLFCAPLITRSLDRIEHERLALLLGVPAYFWMCGLLWFSMFWVPFLLARGITRRPVLPARSAFYTISGIVALLGIYGWREAHDLHIEQVHIPCAHFPAGRPPLRIALLSDLHWDVHRNHRLLAQGAAQIKTLQPDLILSAGDLADSPHCLSDAAQFATLRAPLGKYAVLGNHEYYLGLRYALPFHERSGFTLLRQTAREIAPGIWLAGVDNQAGHYFRQPCFSDERAALAGIPTNVCVILLKHEPRVAAHLPADLVLSGHTHHGQVFPFHLLVRWLYPNFTGLHQLDQRTQIYITRGIGTWGPPFRLFAPPEITLLILESPSSR